MKFFTALSLLLIPAAATAYSSINPTIETLSTRNVPSEIDTRCTTNADCMKRKQPLLAPRRRGANHARAPVPSNLPLSGTIELFDPAGVSQGFVSATRNSFGEYGVSKTEPLKIELESRLQTAPQNILTSKAVSGWSGLAAIVGFSNGGVATNFGSGSYNYAYLGGSDLRTPVGSSAQVLANSFTAATLLAEPIETAIFLYNPSTMAISAQWINEDGSGPATYLLYYKPDNVVVLTGDVAAFEANFGPTFVQVTARFVLA